MSMAVNGYSLTTNYPVSIQTVAAGSIAAGGPLLSSAFTAPSNGSIVMAITLASGATSSVLQVTRNNSFYGNLNNGVALAAQNEFDANIPVAAGDVVQFALATATMLGQAEFFFIPSQ